jgi:DNA-binding protein H-NS
MELNMAKSASNLANMSVDALLHLRDEIGATLSRKSRELQGQLQRLQALGPARAGRNSHPRTGVKVAPKYRGPNGDTWAGRGATPKWLTALMKQGRKRDEFLIERPKMAAASRKRSNVKRSARKRK